MVLPNRAAQRKAPLVVADELFAAADRSDWRDGCEELVAVEIKDISVDVVGPRLEHHVGVGAGIAALVGFAARLHGELVDGLDRDKAPGDTGDTALVGSDDTEPGVHIVGAIDLVVDA